MELSRFESLMDEIINKKISDLHLTSGDYAYIRVYNGDLQPVTPFGVLSAEDIIDIIGFVSEKPIEEKTKTIDAAYTRGSARFRVNVSRVIVGWCLSFRTIPQDIPTPESIHLPAHILQLTERDKGMILVTGATGSGKSTTMAAMVEHINKTTSRHIITLEDPIEFTYENKKSLVHQREYGKHFDSFLSGIKSILREDPDVIVVGEMRDIQTMEAAITLAETGHLVISTLHTNDTVQTVDRIIQSFPAQSQNQIRMQLGLALAGVVSQVLIPKRDGSGRVAAREVLISNDSTRNLIIRGETQHLYSMIEISKQEGMNLMDDSIIHYLSQGVITRDEALRYIRVKDRSELALDPIES